MRGAFINTLSELAAQDDRIVLMTADLGFTVLEPFAKTFPKRFYNVGVAEQNMMGMATGLAEAGFIPFVYSIGTFASLRGYEFIRNGAILHRLPVRIVGVGGGLEYSTAGMTHHSIDDVGVMRVQTGIEVIAPADATQTQLALQSTWQRPSPIYYRIGKYDNVTIPDLEGRFTFGQPETIGDGTDILLVSMGGISKEADNTRQQLAAEGIQASLAIVSTLNPSTDLAPILANFRYVMTIEEHYINGGLGSMVAEIIAENGINARLHRCGIRTVPDGITGRYEAMRQHYQLSAADFVATAKMLLQKTL